MKTPNVFFAVMDAVRPDHLSCYGYSRKTTPNIDEIAKDGVLFENAFSTAPWTPPSHASMFTGMYPSQHGVDGKTLYLSEEIPTIAEIFTSKGYQTLGICVNPLVGPKTGLHRGFQKFVHSWPSTPPLSDWIIFCLETDVRALVYHWSAQVRLFEEIKRWITTSRKKRKPFFIFVNYLDAHTPYNPCQPFKSKFDVCVHSNVDLKKVRYLSQKHCYPYLTKEVELTREEWNIAKSWYDGEIACIDFFLGKLLSYLKKYELFDNTFTVITSDHGENFGDHQLANHCFCLYDTLLHVPLIIRFPKYTSAKKKISNIVSTIDIFPTLLSVLNIKMEDRIKGKNLIPFDNQVYHKYVYAEYGLPDYEMKILKKFFSFDASMYNKSLKCIRSENCKYIIASNGTEELYDLQKDPDESRNIISAIPEKAKELRSVLTKELGSAPVNRRAATFHDERIIKRLKALGYL